MAWPSGPTETATGVRVRTEAGQLPAHGVQSLGDSAGVVEDDLCEPPSVSVQYLTLVNATAEGPSQPIIKYGQPLTPSRGQCLRAELPEPPG